MPKLIALLALLTAVPYWEAAEVKDWSEEQLIDFFAGSPWVQPAEAIANTGGRDGVTTFLATAKPVRCRYQLTLLWYQHRLEEIRVDRLQRSTEPDIKEVREVRVSNIIVIRRIS